MRRFWNWFTAAVMAACFLCQTWLIFRPRTTAQMLAECGLPFGATFTHLMWPILVAGAWAMIALAFDLGDFAEFVHVMHETSNKPWSEVIAGAIPRRR